MPPNAVVYGNPARIHGYGATSQGTHGEPGRGMGGSGRGSGPRPVVPPSLPGGARIVPLRRADDMRGSLAAPEVRGEHAHRTRHQLLICVHGSLAVLVDDGSERGEVVLDDPGVGLYLPPLIWGSQFGYSADAVLVVLASHPYHGADYIRDYEAFRALVGR